MSLADNAGHKVGVHGAHGPAIDVRDLEEEVDAAPSPAFAVDDLTDPPAAFMRLHQNCVTDTDLQEDRFKRKILVIADTAPPQGEGVIVQKELTSMCRQESCLSNK